MNVPLKDPSRSALLVQRLQRTARPQLRMPEITVNVKSSNESAFQVTVDDAETVLDLKQLIDSKIQLPPADQRLIYSGKVLKDPETVATYKLKDGHTIHLVKGGKKDSAAASPATPAPSPTTQATEPVQAANPMGAANPFAAMGGMGAGANPFAAMGGMGAMGGMPGMQGGQGVPDISGMLNNPMFSTLMSQMMSDPAMLQQMMRMQGQELDPRMAQLMQSEQFRTAMSDPATIQQIMGMGAALGAIPGMGPGAGMGGMGNSAMGGMPGMGSAAGMNLSMGTPGAIPGGVNPQLMNLLSGMRQANTAAPVAPQSTEPPEVRFQTQLAQLVDMGFYNPTENIQALQMSGGNVEAALEWLFSRPSQ
jgi:ubiquilin